jgi:hypothetical protein
MSASKKERGQFYTTNCKYILDGLEGPPPDTKRIIEPFAGKGDLLRWLEERPTGNAVIESYDIEPKRPDIIERDTLRDPPDYTDAWVITNPPYLARNKCESKEIFDLYKTNDLYKCFMSSISKCIGGIVIIPAGFFLSPRDIDVRCRNEFMSRHKILKIRYFEETVFPDTTTTVVAFSFERSPEVLTEQSIEWTILPSQEKKIFKMSKQDDWIIGGDIYKLSVPNNISIRRYVDGKELGPTEQLTHMTLNALDSGKDKGRISLDYKEGYVYPAKDCSRTFATMCLRGVSLTHAQQMDLCERFNVFLETHRKETWSLFLPQYRESKEYARKRIPFELAYTIILHLITAPNRNL